MVSHHTVANRMYVSSKDRYGKVYSWGPLLSFTDLSDFIGWMQNGVFMVSYFFALRKYVILLGRLQKDVIIVHCFRPQQVRGFIRWMQNDVLMFSRAICSKLVGV